MLWAMAFILAEFAASLEWQCYSFAVQQGWGGRVVEYLFLAVFYGGVFGAMYAVERRQIVLPKGLQLTAKDVLAAVLISVGAFLISNISYVNNNTPFSGRMSAEIFYIRTLVDFAGVIMIGAFQEHWREIQANREAQAIDQLFRQQYEQYRQSQESIEIIKQKCHDLKHQIAVIRSESDSRKREEYLQQVESGMDSFAAEHHTGHPVLDTILTGKQLYCLKNHIRLYAVADGEKLDFIETMDLCSIFGNALDNAIESVERIPEEEKRLIRLAVYTKNSFLMIRVCNYFETPLQKEGEDYVTTKADKDSHGYGIKSIRQVAEKYHGTVVISTENSWFYLKILIPLPDGENLAETDRE
jgi:hypothetical protein